MRTQPSQYKHEADETTRFTKDDGLEVSYPDGTKITYYEDGVTEWEPPIDDD